MCIKLVIETSLTNTFRWQRCEYIINNWVQLLVICTSWIRLKHRRWNTLKFTYIYITSAKFRYFRYDTSYVFTIQLKRGGPDYCGQYSNAMDCLGFESVRGQDIFLFFEASTPARVPPSFIINWYWCSFTGVKRPGRNVDHSPPSIYTFMMWKSKTLTL
jgi:hypothetical protein